MPSTLTDECCFPFTFSNFSAFDGMPTARFTRAVCLHLLLNRVPGEQVLRSLLAVSTAGTDDSSAAIDFHFQRVASAFGRVGRSVAEHIVLRLVVRNSLQA